MLGDKHYIGSAGAITIGNSQCETQRQSHIDRELSDIEYSAGRLEEIVGRLANRLQPVLHYNTLNETKNAAPDEVIAPLAERIRTSRKRFELLERQLNAVIEAIEI